MRPPYPSPAVCCPKVLRSKRHADLTEAAQSPTQPRAKLQRFYRFHLFAIVAWITSCQCGREEHRPFTPFGVASDLGSPGASSDTPTDSGPAPVAFAARSAER